MSNYTIQKKDKRIFFIIGAAGWGKTVLATTLKKQLVERKNMFERDVIIFDDSQYSINPKENAEILHRVAAVRHLDQNVIITLHNLPKDQYLFSQNKQITWIFVSMMRQLADILEERFAIPIMILKKFSKSCLNVSKRRLKTRPYLLLTLDKQNRIHYEIHRYKKSNTTFETKGKGNGT